MNLYSVCLLLMTGYPVESQDVFNEFDEDAFSDYSYNDYTDAIKLMGRVGDLLELSCFECALPDWYHNEKLIASKPLLSLKITESDAGHYDCQSYGIICKSYKLEVIPTAGDKPKPGFFGGDSGDNVNSSSTLGKDVKDMENKFSASEDVEASRSSRSATTSNWYKLNFIILLMYLYFLE